jgi:beta-N-acetylhexosaminidase
MTDYQAYSAMLNAGIDMFMVSSAYGARAITEIFAEVKIGVQNNSFDMSRLNEAVTRIIAVKLSMGLVEQVKAQNIVAEPEITTIPEPLKATTEYEDSLTAVRESLVLLKNTDNVLPVTNIKSGIEYVVLVG